MSCLWSPKRLGCGPIRRASKLLQAAYVLVACGLCLDSSTTPVQLSGLLVLNPNRFKHITLLVLTAQQQNVCYRYVALNVTGIATSVSAPARAHGIIIISA